MGYKIEWKEDAGIHIKYDGDLTLNEIMHVFQLISSNPKYALIKYQISDFLGITSLSMPEQDVESLSIFHGIPSLLYPDLKLSIISNETNIQVLVLKYIDFMKGNNWKIKLFDNLEEAIEWNNQK